MSAIINSIGNAAAQNAFLFRSIGKLFQVVSSATPATIALTAVGAIALAVLIKKAVGVCHKRALVAKIRQQTIAQRPPEVPVEQLAKLAQQASRR